MVKKLISMVKIITVNNWILKETLRFISMIKFQLATQVKFKLKPTDLTPNLDKLMVFINRKSLKIDQSF